MICIDDNERLVVANKLANSLLGEGTEDRHYITALRQPAVLDCIENALKQRQVFEAIYHAKEQSREATYQVRAVPVTLDGAKFVIASFEDTTHMQQVGLMRRDFVANVSHELRTPLTAVLGFIETLQGPAKDDPKARERFLGIMQNEAERMNRLVNDLLSLSRVEAEERVRPTKTVDLAIIVAGALETLRPIANSYDVKFSMENTADAANVLGDPDQLTQVFANLFENAVKYGRKPGQVTIRISHNDHEPMLRAAAIRVDVQDDGEGIDLIHIPRLTERFYRVDGHRSREQGGTGLGLAIVKHIVNRHRGRLRITSEKGRGSCFSVILPAA